MPGKKINRIVAAGVFLASFVVYLLTLSRTVVFWDVGEYLASAFLLQVPHPPGAPLLLLVGHLFSMIPFSTDIAYRMHLVSALSGAIVVTFLYLVSVKVFKLIRGTPESALDAVVVYGVAAVGALTLAFSYSFWNNSIEFEAKGTAMFFVAFIFWLALRWSERADRPHNEKYLLLIAYLVGLCIGVRPLAVLMIFPVGLIVYFTRYTYERRSFLRFSIGSVLVLAAVYPGIVQFLPSLLSGEFLGIQSEIFRFVPLLLILAAAYGAWRTIQTNQKTLHLACLVFLLVVLGYTTYFEVLMRSNVDSLPINENRPNNITNFVSYISRDQYGHTPQFKGESWDNEQQTYVEKLFPRRWSQEPMHEPTRVNYTSDADFLWRYQINHMYIRYLLRNFVGADGYVQDDGVSASGTLAIPFLLGLIGMYYHFRKDWKMATVFLSAFLLMGLIFALYQNQQEPQPRERDYFYAGSYFVFSLWIGAGILAIMDALKKRFAEKSFYASGTVGVLALAALVVPVNLLRINWHIHDRSANYVAWDYSYNILQSCAPDAILFTNGDNDTFPLWYLQSVEGIRRDVRIVNLSLVNTNWYIWELKNETPYGTKKVALSFTDQQIDRLNAMAWKSKQVEIPVPRNVAARFGVTDSATLARGSISFTLEGIPYSNDFRVLRVQDIMVQDIIMANKWERPIYFAMTCSRDSKIGLDNYLWMEGLAFRLEPRRIGADGGMKYDNMASNVLAENAVPSKTYQPGFLYRNLNKPGAYYDDNVQRMVTNYRFNYMRLAEYQLRFRNNPAEARHVLGQMEHTLPLDIFPIDDWRLGAYVMSLFHQAADSANSEKWAKVVEGGAVAALNSNQVDEQNPFQPYMTLLEIYDMRKDYQGAIDLLNGAISRYPNVTELKARLQYYQNLKKTSSLPDSGKPR